MAEDIKWIAEKELAKALNVPRASIKKFRANYMTRTTGLVIEWQEDAAQAVALKLGLVLPRPEKNSAPADTSELLTVVRAAPNRIIVYARRENGDLIQVRVKDNSRYVPIGRDGKPMKFRARPDGTGIGRWWIVTGPEPRRGVSTA